MMEPFKKEATWIQSKDTVYVDFIFPVDMVKAKVEVTFTPGKLNFRCKGLGLTINLLNTIDEKVSTFEKGKNSVLCILKKTKPAKRWIRLQKEKKTPKWLSLKGSSLASGWKSESDASDDDFLGPFKETPVLDHNPKVKVTGMIKRKGRCRGYAEAMIYRVGPIDLLAKLELEQPWGDESNVKVGWVQGISYMNNSATYEDDDKKDVGKMIIDFSKGACLDSYGGKLPWFSANSFVELKKGKQFYTIKLHDLITGKFPWYDPSNQTTPDQNIRLRSCYEANQFTSFLIAINMKKKAIQELRRVHWKFEIKINVRTIGDEVNCELKTAIVGLTMNKELSNVTLEECILDGKNELKKIEDTINKSFRRKWIDTDGSEVKLVGTDEDDEDGVPAVAGIAGVAFVEKAEFDGQTGVNLHEHEGDHPEDVDVDVLKPAGDDDILPSESDDDFKFDVDY